MNDKPKSPLVRFFVLGITAMFAGLLSGWAPDASAQIIISVPPQSATNTVGDNVEFFVGAANGSDTLTYQWTNSSGNILNATNRTLVLTNVQLASADTYTVVITDSSASLTNSASAVLTVDSTFNPAPGLVLWLPFNDGVANSGAQTAADASGNGNNGTLQNFEDDGNEWVPGVTGPTGGALFFANTNGLSNNVVLVNDAANLNFTNKLSFSISVWVAGEAWSTFWGSLYDSPFSTGQLSGGANILSKGYGGGGEQYELDVDSGDVRFYTRDSAGANPGNPQTSAALNNAGLWTHIVCTFDGNAGITNMSIYINGVLSASHVATNSLFPSAGQTVNIGNRQTSSTSAYLAPFVGVIDDVRIYNYALSASDAQALYNSYSTSASPDIFAIPAATQPIFAGGNLPLYPFDNGFSALSYGWSFSGTNATTATNAATLTVSNLVAGSNGVATLTVSNTQGKVSTSVTVNGVAPYPYAAAVMALNPLVYYPLNETNNKSSSSASAVAYDYARANNAIVGNKANIGVSGPGQPQYNGFPAGNQALGLLQQTNGFAQPAAIGLTGTSTATFTAWIYTTANTQASSAGLIFNRQSGNGGGMDYNGHLGYTWNDNSSSTYNWNSGLIPSNGVWTFVAIAIGSSSTVGYMGGANANLYSAVNSVASTETASWTTQGLTFIGEDSNSSTVGAQNTSRIFNGEIAQAAVFNYQLSQAEIQSLYYAAGFVPQFRFMLASTNVNQGQNATISVTNISGTLPMSYSWYSIATNGASNALASGSLSNYSGNTLSWTITNAQPAVSGTVYYLSISNQYGTALSNTLVNVFAAPTFTSGTTPVNPIIYAGQTITFSAAADGAQPITYFWSTNGTLVSSGTNATSVTLANVPQGAWTVTCSASNSVSVTSNSTTLTVLAVPAAGFPQAVLSLQPMGYWRLNESEQGGGDDGVICHDYAQGNNGTFTNVVLGDLGYDSADSSIAGFTYDTETCAAFGTTSNSSYGPNSCVFGIPNIDFSKPAGTAVNFSVQAWAYGYGNSVNTPSVVGKGIYGNEEFTIDSTLVNSALVYRFTMRDAGLNPYYVNSIVPANDQKWHFLAGVCDQAHGKVTFYVDGTNAASLFITNAGLAGTYASFPMSIGSRSSAGTNGYDQQFNGFVNDVAVFNYALSQSNIQNEYYAAGIAPAVSLPTNNLAVNENGTLTETASATGTPPLAYQWYYTDTTNNIFTATGQTNATLALTNVQPYYYTVYVVVTNEFGTATSAPTYLSVNQGSAYIFQDISPLNIDAPAGATLGYSVVAYGADPIYYEWVLNGTSVVPGATNSSYTFTALSGTNTYQCGVSNSQSSSYTLGQMATVTALSAPPEIGFFTNGTGWQLQGSGGFTPTINNNVLELTDGSNSIATSAYYTTMQYIASGFVAAYTYTPSAGTSTRADGIAFVVQDSPGGAFALGEAGGALGLYPTVPSVSFDMDIFTGSPGGTGINWETNGMTAGNGGVPNAGTGSVNINSGDPINVTIIYTASSNNVQVTLEDTSTHASYTTNYSTGNLASMLGNDIVYVGFTGGSGGDTAVQQVSDFTFEYIAPQEPPSIIEDVSPLSQAVYAGTQVTYSIEAEGTAPLSYAWFENNSQIPGATNSSYTFAAPLGTNTFQCGVSNSLSGGVYIYSSLATLYGAPIEDAFGINVLNYGPVAFWRLDEAQGSTIAYDYAGGFNGAYGSLTTNGQAGVPNPPFLGMPGGELGVWMDSASASDNGFVSTPAMDISLTNATLLCWVYPSGSQNVSEGLVFSRGTAASGSVEGINYAANNSFGYTWGNNSATYDWSSGLSIPTNAWSFLALVITPSNAVGYVFNSNGATANTNNVPNTVETLSAGFSIGADPQSSTLSTRIFNGEMDDVAVFDYALTPAQLGQLYSSATMGLRLTITRSGGNYVISWPFGALYQASSAAGPYTAVPGATSPYTNTPSSSKMFYRVVATP